MPSCPCLSDTLCCVCGTPCIRDRDGHMIHADCEKPPNREPAGQEPEAPAETIAVPPNVADLSPERRAELERQAEEEDVPF